MRQIVDRKIFDTGSSEFVTSFRDIKIEWRWQVNEFGKKQQPVLGPNEGFRGMIVNAKLYKTRDSEWFVVLSQGLPVLDWFMGGPSKEIFILEKKQIIETLVTFNCIELLEKHFPSEVSRA